MHLPESLWITQIAPIIAQSIGQFNCYPPTPNSSPHSQNCIPVSARSLSSTLRHVCGRHPLNRFPASRSVRRLERFFRLSGTLPTRLFQERSNTCKLARPPISAGISPVSPLSTSPSSAVAPPGGSVVPSMPTPFHWRMENCSLQFRVASPVSLSRSSRSTAQSATKPSFSCGFATAVSLEHRATRSQKGSPVSEWSLIPTVRTVSGIQPVSSFSWRYNSCRLVRLPSSAGISPVNRLSLRYSHCSPKRPPSIRWDGSG